MDPELQGGGKVGCTNRLVIEAGFKINWSRTSDQHNFTPWMIVITSQVIYKKILDK